MFEADHLGGGIVDPRAGAVSLNDYFPGWLASRLVKGGRPLTPATRIGYERVWRRNMSDTIGRRLLRDVRLGDVREWHSTLSAATSPDQAAKSYRQLRAMMATAEEDELIRSNPCRIRGAGEEHHAERPQIETALVLDLADAIGERLRALVLVAGFGGLRTGESLGLRRLDVDLLHNTVSVVQQAQEMAGMGRILVAPKSEAGRRVVVVPAIVVEALGEHLDRFTDTDPDAPVFTSPRGGPLRRASLSDAWREAVRATGAPTGLHLHDLRPHAATLTARTPGVTTKELMARIGHSSPRAALIYQHASPERDQAVASFLDAVVASTERTTKAPVTRIREG